jgi:hypothetical protein
MKELAHLRSAGLLVVLAALCSAILVALIRTGRTVPESADSPTAPLAGSASAQLVAEQRDDVDAASERETIAIVADAPSAVEHSVGPTRRIVRGTVLERPDLPAPGVEIEVGVERSGKRTSLAIGSSGADGRYEIRVSVGEDAFRGPPSALYARVARAGCQKDVASMRLAPDQETVELDLMLVKGATLSGRVVTSDGKLVRTASIELLEEGETSRSGKATMWVRRGLFDLHYTRAGTYRVQVRARGVGTATVEHLRLDPERDPELLTITIRDPDFLAGVLRDPAGQGLSQVEIEAVSEARATERPRSPRSDERYRLRATTDTHGCFEIDGLSPGRYYLVTERAPDGGPLLRDLTLYSTGENHIALVRERPSARVATPEPR